VINYREILEAELALVKNYLELLDRHYYGRGLLIIPEGLTAADNSWEDEDSQTFEEELMEALMRPIDPDSPNASCFIPIIIRGPEELTDKIRHIDLDTEVRQLRNLLGNRANTLKTKLEKLDTDE
jgi:hypothetical protein